MAGRLSPFLSPTAEVPSLISQEDAFAYPRDFLGNKFIYVVISPRARGLSIGVNFNPVTACNLDCVYCEVDRNKPPRALHLDIECMADELRRTLKMVRSDGLRQLPGFSNVPPDLLELRHVALSGNGEPTLSDQFVEATEAVIAVRAAGPFFKIVLISNSTVLERQQVQRALRHLTSHDEVWLKLDGGTQEYLNKINGTRASLNAILKNIQLIGQQRPIVIQSLFPAINGEGPTEEEIIEYARRLKELKKARAKISLVQIYSATRPMAREGCGHLPLKELTNIAQTVRRVARLPAEVY